jgi:penicillin-binding protein 1A
MLNCDMVVRGLRFLLDSLFLVVTVAVGVPVLVTVTVLGALLFLPLPAAIPQPRTTAVVAPTQVYDRFGNPIASFRQFDQSVPLTESDIPVVLKEAVVSIEDRNYYQHGGVDVRGSIRALMADLRNQRAVQGGSTITQQYVKLTYTGSQRTVLRKIREAILASQLERQATKDEILFRYLSVIYLGDGNYGVGAAAESYFGKPVKDLTLSEAATLAGLIAAPSAWAPRENPDTAEARREVVLDKMLGQGYITLAQHDDAIAKRIWLQSKGPAPAQATLIHTPVEVQSKYPAFVDYVRRYLLAKYGPQKVYEGGLRVQTTLDPKIQDAADQAVQNALRGTKEPLQMALAAVEPQTGFVQAVVGGREFGQGPFASVNFALGGCEARPKPTVVVEVPATCWTQDTITGGGAGRQPGSAWKPFVLAEAFAKGFSPNRVYRAPGVYNIPGCPPRQSGCTISNNEPYGGGSADIRHATWDSINTVYAQMVRDVGCADTGTMAKKLGVNSAWYSSQVQHCGGQYALGEVGVSPLDMASAYGVFDNHGARAEPTPVLKILDVNNRVLEDNITNKPGTSQVLDPVIADNVTDVLRGVISYGTGTAADIGRPAAGKTGTTSNFTNAWFCGYAPSLSTAVWMGYADNQNTALKNINGVGSVYGGTIPAQVWHAFMAAALANVPATDFTQPAPLSALQDKLNSQQRQGINPGPQRSQEGTGPGGSYQIQAPSPKVQAPTTTTSTPPTTFPGAGEGGGQGGRGGTTTTTFPFPF